MTTYTADHLYALLPTIYRIRDAEQGGALKQLIGVIAKQIGIVEEDIDQLYADWFIETCAEWVVPYIGDLLGVRGLYAIAETGFTQRAIVANTLAYRRRKGTATMLEQLAHDTTLWNARAVEFFQLLGTTQYLNHLRPDNVRTPDLRDTNALALLNTPFDTIAHTGEVRRIASGRGKYNIPNVGIFLWRLQAYYMPRSTPRAVPGAPAGRFTFSPLGNDMPLFNRPQTEETITHLAEEANVPDRLRRRALYDDLEQYRRVLTSGRGLLASRYFDAQQPVLEIYFDQPCTSDSDCTPLRPEEIVICNLSDWDAPGWEPPEKQVFNLPTTPVTTFETKVAVDPVLGRLAPLKNIVVPPTRIEVRYAYGFSGDLGGGPYDRRLIRLSGAPAPAIYDNSVAELDAFANVIHVPSTGIDTLGDALAAWSSSPAQSMIQIDDSHTYEENLPIAMAAGDLVIQAANGQRPTLIGDVTVTGNQQGRLGLNGLLIAGSIHVADDDSLRQLDLIHCTLVPGINLHVDNTPMAPTQPSIVANPDNRALRLHLTRSMSGPLHLPGEMVALTLRDSIIESPIRNQPATITPALVSGPLSPFPTITAALPQVQVTIGNDGPYIATLASAPATLAPARDLLQDAIRAAHDSTAFRGARVVTANNRLIVVPGVPSSVTIAAVESDDTADLLRFSPTTSQPAMVLISGVLAPFPAITAGTPALTAIMGSETHEITLAAVPTSLATARDLLRDAVRNASATPAFANAMVASLGDDNQLVVVPGAPDTIPRFDTTAGDTTTLAELRLARDLPALAGDLSGVVPGPPATLERVTVLGTLHVKELTLASEVIFSNTALADRRQAGCVRFSYVAPASRTPRRFHCQPDLAITTAIANAKEAAGGTLGPSVEAAIHRQTTGRLVPSFTSTRYGDPAYGQLSLTCATEIRTGAENGSEMGAFAFLQQPQREANLRSSLDEYLRFGLEAGIFYVT